MSRKPSIDDVFAPVTALLKSVREPAVDVRTALSTKKVVGLYFSADWCGPCRAFTPRLVQFYNDRKSVHPDDFEVVFVSRDRSASSFASYYSKMPWLAISFSDNDVAAALSDRYGVSGIPALILLNSDGVVATVKGRDLVTSNPRGFPWGIVPAAGTGAKYDKLPEI